MLYKHTLSEWERVHFSGLLRDSKATKSPRENFKTVVVDAQDMGGQHGALQRMVSGQQGALVVRGLFDVDEVHLLVD